MTPSSPLYTGRGRRDGWPPQSQRSASSGFHSGYHSGYHASLTPSSDMVGALQVWPSSSSVGADNALQGVLFLLLILKSPVYIFRIE